MNRLLGLLCAALLALTPTFAAASMTTTGAGKPTVGGGGGGYTGPGDVVAGAKAWYGLRAFSAAKAAAQAPAIRLARASNADKCDVNVTTAGDLSTVTANCSNGLQNGTVLTNGSTGWCDGTTCKADTWYDQVGTADAIASATAPTITFSCLGAKLCLQFGGAGGLLATSATTTTHALTVSAVAIRTSGTAQADIISGANGIFFNPSSPTPNQVGGYFGNQPGVTANDNVWHAMQFVVNSTSSAINVDGTDTASGVDYGTGDLSSGYYIGQQNTGQYLTGKMMEVGVWGPTLGFNGTQRGSMCHNQFVYYGTPTSC